MGYKNISQIVQMEKFIQNVQVYTECTNVYRIYKCIQNIQMYTECTNVYIDSMKT